MLLSPLWRRLGSVLMSDPGALQQLHKGLHVHFGVQHGFLCDLCCPPAVILTLHVTDDNVVTLLQVITDRLRKFHKLNFIVYEIVVFNPADVNWLDPAPGGEEVLRKDVQDAGNLK